jgi:hypothetical protein
MNWVTPPPQYWNECSSFCTPFSVVLVCIYVLPIPLGVCDILLIQAWRLLLNSGKAKNKPHPPSHIWAVAPPWLDDRHHSCTGLCALRPQKLDMLFIIQICMREGGQYSIFNISMTTHNSEEWVPNSSIWEAMFPIERNFGKFQRLFLPGLHGNNHKPPHHEFTVFELKCQTRLKCLS